MVAVKRLLDTFSLRMRRNGYLGASGQKSDPAIRCGDLDVTLTYDLLTLAMSGELSFACPVHVPNFSIL